MEIKNKIEKKIYALLQKTEENGATREEAIAAMAKARELAEIYAINLSDVKKPMQGEKLTVARVDIFNSGYDFTGILFWLSKYFDVKVVINNTTTGKYLAVYGFQTDIDLFAYFYNFTCKSCLNDLNDFKRTVRYHNLLSCGAHGRTIAANFIKGYCYEVATKLKADYNERKEVRTQTTALVLVEKEKKVEDFYKSKISGKRLRTKTPSRANGAGGYFEGKERGARLNLTHAIN